MHLYTMLRQIIDLNGRNVGDGIYGKLFGDQTLRNVISVTQHGRKCKGFAAEDMEEFMTL